MIYKRDPLFYSEHHHPHTARLFLPSPWLVLAGLILYFANQWNTITDTNTNTNTNTNATAAPTQTILPVFILPQLIFARTLYHIFLKYKKYKRILINICTKLTIWHIWYKGTKVQHGLKITDKASSLVSMLAFIKPVCSGWLPFYLEFGCASDIYF